MRASLTEKSRLRVMHSRVGHSLVSPRSALVGENQARVLAHEIQKCWVKHTENGLQGTRGRNSVRIRWFPGRVCTHFLASQAASHTTFASVFLTFTQANEFCSMPEIGSVDKKFSMRAGTRLIRDLFTSYCSSTDTGGAEQATLFLVSWHDWQDHITDVLLAKKDSTVLVVYAPPQTIPPERMKDLDGKRNVILTNFRGRLLNDIVVSLMTTGYQ